MPRHLVRSAFAIAALAAVLAASIAPAAAAPTHFAFTYDDASTDASCGFSVTRHDVGKGHITFRPDSVYITNAGVVTVTNPDTGLSVTERYNLRFTNVNQVDNGDGTNSLDQTTKGSWTLYSATHKILLRDRGTITVHLVTIPDPFEVVSREILFEHGTHHDEATYCHILTTTIGPDAAS